MPTHPLSPRAPAARPLRAAAALLLGLLGACVVPLDPDGDGVRWPADCDDHDPTAGVAEPAVWYPDADGDGYGDPAASTLRCSAPPGYVSNGQDCDDTDPQVAPSRTWYADLDGDGYGDPDRVQTQCEAPQGFVAQAGDCDDGDARVPGVVGLDLDGDGYTDSACAGGDDCDDTDPQTFPGALEQCDGQSNACDPSWRSDEGVALWAEQVESGEHGGSCAVGSALQEGGAVDCVLRDCPPIHPELHPDEHAEFDGLCCVCDLTGPLEQAAQRGGDVWHARLESSETGFSPHALLRFCEGDYPLQIAVTHVPSSVEEQLLVLDGVAAVGSEACAEGTEGVVTTLQGTPGAALVQVDGFFTLGVEVTNLLLDGGAVCTSTDAAGGACPAAPIAPGGGGLVVRSAGIVQVLNSCVRKVAHAATEEGDYGGAITLGGVLGAVIEDTTLVSSCSERGGGLYSGLAVLSLRNVTVQDNLAWCLGGGLYAEGTFGVAEGIEGTLQAERLVLQGNRSDTGAGGGLVLVGGAPSAYFDSPASGTLVDSYIGGGEGSGIVLVERVDEGEGPVEVCSEVVLEDVNFDVGAYPAVELLDPTGVWSQSTLWSSTYAYYAELSSDGCAP